MIRDTILQILQALAATAGTALLAWFTVTARRLLAQRFYVAQSGVLERRTRAVVAETQGDVDTLKDPTKPGVWSPAMAASVRAEAVRRVRALEPLACETVLNALGADASADAKLNTLIGTYVEEAVRSMRQWETTASSPTAPASTLANERALPRPEAPAPIAPAANPQAGHIRPALLGVLMLFGAAGLTIRCTASAVETHAAAADRIARTLNAVEPRWIAESQRRAIAAAHDLCSLDAGPCDRARAHAAADAVLSQWEPVVAAWDSFAAAHDVWRVALEGCRARHDAVCSPSVEAATTMLRAVGTWRCAVRAVGHAEYDPLPGEPACTDGGAS